MQRRKWKQGLLALGGVIAVWTGWALLSRWGLGNSHLDSLDLTLLRLGVGACVMLPFLIWKGGIGIPWRDCLLLAATAGPGYALLTYNALRFAPASHGTAFTSGILPVFTTVGGIVTGQQRPTRMRWVGLALVLAGAAAFFIHGIRSGSPNVWLGDLMLIAGTVLWATYTLRERAKNYQPAQVAGAVTVVGMALYLPIYLIWGHPGHFAQASLPLVLLQGFWQGVLVAVCALVLFTRAVRLLGPSNTTAGTAAVPALTAVGAMLLLGESFSVGLVAGIALNAAGLVTIALAARPRHQQKVQEAREAHGQQQAA